MRTSNQESLRTIGCLLALLAVAIVIAVVVVLNMRLLPAGTTENHIQATDRQQMIGVGLSGNPIYRDPALE